MSEDGLRNPFVIQCKDCRKILADSFTLQTMKHSYLIHTYSTVGPEGAPRPGVEAFDRCLVQDVVCVCSARVGVFIVSSSAEWNGNAEMYAFSRDAVTSYVLGNSVSKEKGICELIEDVEKLKNVVAKIYKKVYQ